MAEESTVDVLCVGETMLALHAAGRISLGGSLSSTIAGAESNVAIALSRMGHRAAWAGVLGEDQAGALVERTLRAEGVQALVRSDPMGFTGILLREDGPAGVTSVDYHRRGSAGSRLDVDDVTRALARARPRIVHVSGITAALSGEALGAVHALVDKARTEGAFVSLDVNHRRRLWTDEQAGEALSPLVDRVSLLFGSPDELALLAPRDISSTRDGVPSSDELAGSLLRAGCPEVVVKLGADGAAAYTSEESAHAPARRVRVIDPVGAGDGFAAGYLSGVLDGLDLAFRLDRGVVLGAFAVASRGDWEGLPHRSELALVDVAEGETLR